MKSPDARLLGVTTLALLVLLALPGIALALQYAPDPARAHEAVAASDAGPLRLARGAHAWAASFALALVLVHLARAYVADRARVLSQRALLGGLAALAVLVAAYFTGTILPWDQQGYEAFGHLRSAAPFVATDDAPEDAPLRALFLLHIFAVPLGLALLLGAHLRRDRWRGDLARVGRLARSAWPALVGVAILVQVVAWLAPPPLGPAPLEGVAVSRPDWPFLWLVPLQDAFGRYAVYALPALFVGAAFAFLRAPTRASPVRRRIVVASGLVLFVALTLLGAR